MKFYSEKLNRMFDSEKDLVVAEKERDEALAKAEAKKKELADARKARAAAIEEARKSVVEAQKKYTELLKEFCKDYGAYHTSLKSDELPSFNSLFDYFWGL